MQFTKDLQHNHIPYSCEQCCFKLSCQKKIPCDSFYPDNMDMYMEKVTTYLKESLPLSKEKRLKRHVVTALGSHGITSDTTTLDGYYVGMINDSLSEIRKGRTAYLFSVGQIKDVMRFERDIKVRRNECGYEVSKVNYTYKSELR